jgi:hypothetical protein
MIHHSWNNQLKKKNSEKKKKNHSKTKAIAVQDWPSPRAPPRSFQKQEVGLGVDEQRSLDLKILSKVEYIYFKKRHRMRFFVIIF